MLLESCPSRRATAARTVLAAAASCVSLFAVQSASAQITPVNNWTGAAGDNQWTTDGNWSVGSFPRIDNPTGRADDIFFNGSTPLAITISGTRNAGRINVANTSTTALTGSNLALRGGVNMLEGAGAFSISGSLNLNGTTQTYINNSTSTLSVGTNVVNGGNGSVGTFTVEGSGPIVLGGGFNNTGTAPNLPTTSLIKNGTGSFQLGNGSFRGSVTMNGGALLLAGGNALGDGAVAKTATINAGDLSGVGLSARTINAQVSFVIGGDFGMGTHPSATQSLAFAGTVDLGGATRVVTVGSQPAQFQNIVSNGGLTKAGAGTLTLAVANTYAGGTTVDAGTLVATVPNAINTGQAVTINGGTLRSLAGQLTALDVGTLSVAAPGRLDLNDGGLVKRNASGAAGQTATQAVTASLKTGLENGGNFDWLGNGISSTEANADNATAGSVLYGLGVVQNNLASAGSTDGTTTDETAGNTIYTTFKGRTVGLNETLVRYTYMGDADLSGNIDGTDYSLIDAGFGAGLKGWINGDFDYSGAIDGTDYALIDNAFGAQTGVLPEQFQAMVAEHTALFGQSYVDALAAVQSGVVPEPGALGVLALAGGGLLGRSRRRRGA